MNIYTEASNPIWFNIEHTLIQLRVNYVEFGVRDVQTDGLHDNIPAGMELWTRTLNGDFGVIAEYISPVPQVITAAQARIALRRANIRASVEKAIKLADAETQDWYEYASEWHRDSAVLGSLASVLNLTDDKIDELFRVAATIT